MARDMKDFILRLQVMNANLDFISKRSVAVGWVDGNKKHSDYKSGKKHAKGEQPSLAQIARILNYGTAPQFKPDGSIQQRIPARPFMEVLRSEYGDYLNKVATEQAKKIIAGTANSADFFRVFGTRAKGALKRAMLQSGRYAPNAPSTVRRKGSSRPLFDTGTLINSADYEVRIRK
jgi:hypothetical protein